MTGFPPMIASREPVTEPWQLSSQKFALDKTFTIHLPAQFANDPDSFAQTQAAHSPGAHRNGTSDSLACT